MRFKGTIFLTVLLIFLGFYLYWVELPGAEKKKEVLLQEGRLFNFQLHEISRITVRSPKGEVEFEYFPNHPSSPWRIFHPVETIANQNVAEELASRIINLKASRLVEAKPKELHEFGLDPAPYRILVTINQTDTEVIEIGDDNLTGTDVYLRKGMGTSLYLVPKHIRELIDKELNEWRQQEIFPFSPESILGIKISSAEGQMIFEKSQAGWSIENHGNAQQRNKTVKVRGDFGEIANLLGTLLNFRGERFIDFKKGKWQANFGPPLATVALQVSQVEREATFYQDGLNPDIVYAITPNNLDPIFQIPAAEFRSVSVSFETYRDRRLFALDFPGQIEEMDVNVTEKVYTLKLDNGKWFIKEPENVPREVTDLNLVSRLQTDMYHLSLDMFQDGIDPEAPKAGLKNSRQHITLWGKNNIPLGELRLGRTSGDGIVATSTSQPYPFLIHQNVFEAIPEAKDFFVVPKTS